MAQILFIAAVCWNILIKGIFYLKLKNDSVNTDKFTSSRLVFPLFDKFFHSGNNMSYGDQHKTAKYKNMFLSS